MSYNNVTTIQTVLNYYDLATFKAVMISCKQGRHSTITYLANFFTNRSFRENVATPSSKRQRLEPNFRELFAKTLISPELKLLIGPYFKEQSDFSDLEMLHAATIVNRAARKIAFFSHFPSEPHVAPAQLIAQFPELLSDNLPAQTRNDALVDACINGDNHSVRFLMGPDVTVEARRRGIARAVENIDDDTLVKRLEIIAILAKDKPFIQERVALEMIFTSAFEKNGSFEIAKLLLEAGPIELSAVAEVIENAVEQREKIESPEFIGQFLAFCRENGLLESTDQVIIPLSMFLYEALSKDHFATVDFLIQNIQFSENRFRDTAIELAAKKNLHAYLLPLIANKISPNSLKRAIEATIENNGIESFNILLKFSTENNLLNHTMLDQLINNASKNNRLDMLPQLQKARMNGPALSTYKSKVARTLFV